MDPWYGVTTQPHFEPMYPFWSLQQPPFGIGSSLAPITSTVHARTISPSSTMRAHTALHTRCCQSSTAPLAVTHGVTHLQGSDADTNQLFMHCHADAVDSVHSYKARHWHGHNSGRLLMGWQLCNLDICPDVKPIVCTLIIILHDKF